MALLLLQDITLPTHRRLLTIESRLPAACPLLPQSFQLIYRSARSKVYVGVHRETGQRVAIKAYKKTSLSVADREKVSLVAEGGSRVCVPLSV